MSRISISVRGGAPNPALVMALRRITGSDVAALAEALVQGTPVFDLDLAPTEAQLSSLRQVLAYLRTTAVQLYITEDGREVREHELMESVRAWDAQLARTHAVRGSAGASLP